MIMNMWLITQSLKNGKIVAWHNADPIILIYFAWLASSTKLSLPNTPFVREPGRINVVALNFDSWGPQKELSAEQTLIIWTVVP
jgi:hypothetical protein